jgi:PIN domain nuclease of toxin-antitoxin system
MVEWVLDSSAILAFVQEEPGSEFVAGMLPDSAVSANNLAEVVTRFWDHGIAEDDIQAIVDAFDFEVVAVDRDTALEIANLRPLTRSAGLSLGDRSCLALARRLGVPALTADKAWDELAIEGTEIRQIR